MAGLTLSGSDFKGGGGGPRLEEAGNYPCTLIGANAYINNKFQSEETRPQLTLIWDTGYIGENADGEEVPVLIYDAWINLTLNEKSNLTERLTALLGGSFEPETASLHLGGVNSLDDLTHWKDGRTDLTSLQVNGQEMFGQQAHVSVVMNDKGYPKVTGVTAPPKAAPAGTKLKKAAAPAGAPV